MNAKVGMTKTEVRELLRSSGLRATAPRVSVIQVLADADTPLSHTEVVERLGDMDFDPTTVYRNLVKLHEEGLAPVVSRLEGIDRYALASGDGDGHQHPHFVCEDCGRVACLPTEVTAMKAKAGPWAASIKSATIQLRGECPDCLEPRPKRRR